jgi:cholesterol transport system auxiliary component
MKALTICLLASTLAATLTGCALGVDSPRHYYVLEAPSAMRPAALPRSLRLEPTIAPAFYDDQHIIFSPVTGQRAYYQLNSWTEPPARRVDALLAQRLADAGLGRGGELTLSLRLEEIYHDAATPPGKVFIAMAATLYDPAQHRVVGRAHFEASAVVHSYDAAGAVEAFNRALGGMLDDVVDWAAAAAPTPQARLE